MSSSVALGDQLDGSRRKESRQSEGGQQASTHDTSNATQPDVEDVADRVEPNPDGGYGWVVVLVCFVHTFWQNAWTGSWGVLQASLLKSSLKGSNSGTVTLIGSLGVALSCGMGIFAIRLARVIGARWTSLIGMMIYGVSYIVSSWTTSNVGGLFVACGVGYGIGACLIYTMSNSLPIQWFSTRLGAANGVIKLGGGIGATVIAVVANQLIEKVGNAWTFRILGFMSLATGVPAAFFIRERIPDQRSYNIDLSLFKDVAFSCLFISGVIGVCSVYAPPFFLPTITTSLGFSSSVSAGVVACFNICMAIGRVGSGYACDKFGSMNTFLLTMALNGITMLVLWTFASTLPLLIVFSVLNGVANGAFFVALPTAVGRLAGERQGAGAVSVTITGWTPGLMIGSPIAGLLIDATGADGAGSIVPFRPAMYYVGGTAMLSLAFVTIARLWVDRRLAIKL